MDGRDQALDDAESLEDHFGDRRQAVSGAGGVGDNRMLAGVVPLVVDPHDERDVLSLGGGGDDHFLSAAVNVGFGFGGVGEYSGRFDHDLSAEIAPGQLGG